MRFTKAADGIYEKDGKLVKDLSELPGAVRALKKPISIVALRIEESFTVETTEGLMQGKPGDYLMEGISKELYICPADIFRKSYDII